MLLFFVTSKGLSLSASASSSSSNAYSNEQQSHLQQIASSYDSNDGRNSISGSYNEDNLFLESISPSHNHHQHHINRSSLLLANRLSETNFTSTSSLDTSQHNFLDSSHHHRNSFDTSQHNFLDSSHHSVQFQLDISQHGGSSSTLNDVINHPHPHPSSISSAGVDLDPVEILIQGKVKCNEILSKLTQTHLTSKYLSVSPHTLVAAGSSSYPSGSSDTSLNSSNHDDTFVKRLQNSEKIDKLNNELNQNKEKVRSFMNMYDDSVDNLLENAKLRKKNQNSSTNGNRV